MTRPRPHCGRAGTETQIFRRPLPHPGRAQAGQEARAPPGWEEPARAPKLDHRPQAGQGGRTGAMATSHRGGRTAVGGEGRAPFSSWGGPSQSQSPQRQARPTPGLHSVLSSQPYHPLSPKMPFISLPPAIWAICRRGRWVSLRLLHLSPHVSPSSPCSLPLSIYSCCVQILASDRCGVKVPGTPVPCDLCGATAICPLPWPAPPFLICATGLTPAVPASRGSLCLPRPRASSRRLLCGGHQMVMGFVIESLDSQRLAAHLPPATRHLPAAPITAGEAG